VLVAALDAQFRFGELALLANGRRFAEPRRIARTALARPAHQLLERLLQRRPIDARRLGLVLAAKRQDRAKQQPRIKAKPRKLPCHPRVPCFVL
jgi:hypothetical protein